MGLKVEYLFFLQQTKTLSSSPPPKKKVGVLARGGIVFIECWCCSVDTNFDGKTRKWYRSLFLWRCCKDKSPFFISSLNLSKAYLENVLRMHCIISTRRYLLSLFSERYKSIPLTIKKKSSFYLFWKWNRKRDFCLKQFQSWCTVPWYWIVFWFFDNVVVYGS